MGGRKRYRHNCSSRRRSSPATVTPACRSQPAHRACSGRDDSTHGASGSPPRRSTRAPARGPSASRPWTAALARPASASDSAASGSVASASTARPRRASNRPMRRAIAVTSRATSASVGRRQAMEPQRPVHPRREHAVEPQCMEVHVQFQPAPEPLHDGDRAAAAIGDAGAPGAATIPAEHGADEDAEHRATERVVERQAVAQPVRHGEHPLAHRHPGQDRVDQVRRLLGHPPPAAARTDRPGLAGKRDEAFEPTGVAPHPGEPPLELPTPEEVAELALDEAREAGAVGGGRRLGQEPVEVRAHDVVQHRPRRGPRLVDPRQHDGAQRRPCRGDRLRPSRHRGRCDGLPERHVQPDTQRGVPQHGPARRRTRMRRRRVLQLCGFSAGSPAPTARRPCHRLRKLTTSLWFTAPPSPPRPRPPRRCARSRGCRRRGRPRPPARGRAAPPRARSIAATRSRCPTAYCGIARR